MKNFFDLGNRSLKSLWLGKNSVFAHIFITTFLCKKACVVELLLIDELNFFVVKPFDVFALFPEAKLKRLIH